MKNKTNKILKNTFEKSHSNKGLAKKRSNKPFTQLPINSNIVPADEYSNLSHVETASTRNIQDQQINQPSSEPPPLPKSPPPYPASKMLQTLQMNIDDVEVLPEHINDLLNVSIDDLNLDLLSVPDTAAAANTNKNSVDHCIGSDIAFNFEDDCAATPLSGEANDCGSSLDVNFLSISPHSSSIVPSIAESCSTIDADETLSPTSISATIQPIPPNTRLDSRGSQCSIDDLQISKTSRSNIDINEFSDKSDNLECAKNPRAPNEAIISDSDNLVGEDDCNKEYLKVEEQQINIKEDSDVDMQEVPEEEDDDSVSDSDVEVKGFGDEGVVNLDIDESEDDSDDGNEDDDVHEDTDNDEEDVEEDDDENTDGDVSEIDAEDLDEDNNELDDEEEVDIVESDDDIEDEDGYVANKVTGYLNDVDNASVEEEELFVTDEDLDVEEAIDDEEAVDNERDEDDEDDDDDEDSDGDLDIEDLDEMADNARDEEVEEVEDEEDADENDNSDDEIEDEYLDACDSDVEEEAQIKDLGNQEHDADEDDDEDEDNLDDEDDMKYEDVNEYSNSSDDDEIISESSSENDEYNYKGKTDTAQLSVSTNNTYNSDEIGASHGNVHDLHSNDTNNFNDLNTRCNVTPNECFVSNLDGQIDSDSSIETNTQNCHNPSLSLNSEHARPLNLTVSAPHHNTIPINFVQRIPSQKLLPVDLSQSNQQSPLTLTVSQCNTNLIQNTSLSDVPHIRNDISQQPSTADHKFQIQTSNHLYLNKETSRFSYGQSLPEIVCPKRLTAIPISSYDSRLYNNNALPITASSYSKSNLQRSIQICNPHSNPPPAMTSIQMTPDSPVFRRQLMAPSASPIAASNYSLSAIQQTSSSKPIRITTNYAQLSTNPVSSISKPTLYTNQNTFTPPKFQCEQMLVPQPSQNTISTIKGIGRGRGRGRGRPSFKIAPPKTRAIRKLPPVSTPDKPFSAQASLTNSIAESAMFCYEEQVNSSPLEISSSKGNNETRVNTNLQLDTSKIPTNHIQPQSLPLQNISLAISNKNSVNTSNGSVISKKLKKIISPHADVIAKAKSKLRFVCISIFYLNNNSIT